MVFKAVCRDSSEIYHCLRLSFVKAGLNLPQFDNLRSEAESKEKHGVWDPMPELTTNKIIPGQCEFGK